MIQNSMQISLNARHQPLICTHIGTNADSGIGTVARGNSAMKNRQELIRFDSKVELDRGRSRSEDPHPEVETKVFALIVPRHLRNSTGADWQYPKLGSVVTIGLSKIGS